MKTLITGLMILGSLSTYAITNFEMEVSTNTLALQGSKNYSAKHTNDDGSISIVKPKFSSPQGTGSLYISIDSDRDGLCKLYGLGSYVSNSTTKYYPVSSGSLVQIGDDGRFKEFDAASSTYSIESFSCVPLEGISDSIAPSDNARNIVQNDDGSITLFKPLFQINGTNFHVSVDSERNGLCKLYGLGSYLSNSTTKYYPVSSGNLVQIGGNGRFKEFDAAISTYSIQSIICNQ